MRFSIGLFPYDRWGDIGALVDAVRLADEAGLDSVSFPEHIVMPVRDDTAPISAVWYENFVLAAHLGAVAPRIRFVFSAMVVPYRHPVHAAKLISTLDTVTGGRVSIVAGSGWMRREFRVLGVPFDERGAMTDEYLRAMRVLWTEDRPTFAGEYVEFSDLVFLPRCVQQPHVPILAGGSGSRAIRRAIEFGGGWSPMTSDLAVLAPGIAQIKEGVRSRGGDPNVLRFTGGVSVGRRDAEQDRARRHVAGDDLSAREVASDVEGIAARVEEAAAVGVTDMGLGTGWEEPAELMRHLEWLGSDVLPVLHTL
jgi:probable F420-dependent oxidoreductase